MDRRSFLGCGAVGLAAATFAPSLAFAKAATDKRFLFVIQRGAADGLATLAPTGDPALSRLRPQIGFEGGSRIDPFFTLHPALKQTAALHAAKQAMFVHAVASPYRDRSHFDGQNVLETGGSLPYRLRDGWMNRRSAGDRFRADGPARAAGRGECHFLCALEAARRRRGPDAPGRRPLWRRSAARAAVEPGLGRARAGR
jgi:uncharacterized protein (DUF1501 family)